MAGRGLFLALAGGGAHAAAHCGVLRSLEREAIPVSGIVAVSGASLVAAAWAGGASMDDLVEQASRLHPWMWVRGWGGGLLSGSRLGALIDEWVPPARFDELRVPLVVVATDVDTGDAVVFQQGSVRDAVRASCSFPGFFPPYALNGRRLVDGSVSEVVPVRRAREIAGEQAGADLVIAPQIGESGWMRPQRIPSFALAGDDAVVEALPELRRLLAG